MTLAHHMHPFAIAVDATDVYWTDASGTVMRVPISGGSPATLASGLGDVPYAIALDESSVYWTITGDAMPNAGSVMMLPKRGGTPITLASGINVPAAIAVDATGVYWDDTLFVGGGMGRGVIMRAPLDGGAPVTVASVPDNFAPAMQSVGGDLFWAAWDAVPFGTGGPDAVYEVPIAGGTVTTIVTSNDVAAPTSLAVDGTHVYWTDGTGDFAVVAAAIHGGAVTTLVSRATDPGSSIAVGGANVYWANLDGSLMRVPSSGGNVTTLATANSPEGPGNTSVALDATSVYWTPGGAIERLTPR